MKLFKVLIKIHLFLFFVFIFSVKPGFVSSAMPAYETPDELGIEPLPHVDRHLIPSDEMIAGFKNVINYYSNLPVSSSAVEIELGQNYQPNTPILVVEEKSNLMQNYLIIKQSELQKTSYEIFEKDINYSLDELNDGNLDSFVNFPVTSNYADNTTQLILQYNSEIISKSLLISFSQYSKLPSSVKIEAQINDRIETVVNEIQIDGNEIFFPKTKSDKWYITFQLYQPLRVSEISLIQEMPQQNNPSLLRFIAGSGNSYKILLNPEPLLQVPSMVDVTLKDIDQSRVVKTGVLPIYDNPRYVNLDSDGDRIPDGKDNCPRTTNYSQEDMDGNGIGDACEDFDNDGIINSKDNCPDNPNSNQSDQDKDNIGDICDTIESRFAEKHPWLLWVGIIYVLISTLVLVIFTLKKSKADKDKNNQQNTQ